MVKKLCKYELTYYLRAMLPFYIILLTVSAFARCIQFFETDSVAYDIFFGFSVGAVVLAILACFALMTVFTIIRYYRNLFTSEGYLTFTLPVTTTQILTSKVLVTTLMWALTAAVVLVAGCIVTVGDVLVELIKAGAYLFGRIPDDWKGHAVLYALEGLLALLTNTVFYVLLIYTCINIGQLFHRARLFMAIVVFFIYNTVVEFIIIMAMVLAPILDWAPLLELFFNHPAACVHGLLCGGILVTALLCAAFYAVSNYIIRHRLNLE